MLYWFLNTKLFFANLFFAQADVEDVCNQGSFFDFPRWYKYLKKTTPEVNGEDLCSPQLNGLNDIWLIMLAVVEMLLRIAILVAIIYVVISGIKFITARGNPDKIQNARNSVQDALIGIVIAVAATAIVSFIAGRFSAS
jgi:hypothetical protein